MFDFLEWSMHAIGCQKDFIASTSVNCFKGHHDRFVCQSPEDDKP